MTPPVPDQPRPVVENAHQQTLVVRIIAAAQLVLAALPAFLIAFELINWTRDQVVAYGIFLGVVITAALLIVGQNVKANALVVEQQVTPVNSPQNNELVPLVPVAQDGLDD